MWLNRPSPIFSSYHRFKFVFKNEISITKQKWLLSINIFFDHAIAECKLTKVANKLKNRSYTHWSVESSLKKHLSK